MQEKIEELIKLHVYPICEYPSGIPDAEELPLVTFGAADIAANEIAKLFERKVIWEGLGEVAYVDYGTLHKTRYTAVDCDDDSTVAIVGEYAKDGQRVRVVVEEIDEAKQGASGDSETVG